MRSLQSLTDKSAIGLSTLCMIHCLIVPIAVTLFPVALALPLEDEMYHKLLLLGIIPTSILALFLGCRRHRVWSVLILGVSGLLILTLSGFFGHDHIGHLGEKIGTVIGSLFIIYSHFRNYNLCKKHNCECK